MPAARSPEEALARARQAAREGDPTAFAAAPSAGLWALRAASARAVVAAEEGTAPPAALPGAAALGLAGLDRWLELDAEASRPRATAPAAPLVARLLSFAREARFEPFARAALLSASRRARTPAEKQDVRAAWDAWNPRGPATPRARIASALGRSRVAGSRAEATAAMQALLRAVPDAPEVAPDLFESADRQLFHESAIKGGEELTLLRANGLASRQPSAAAELALPLARKPGFRLEAAALLLAGGRPEAARNSLVRPPALEGRDAAERLRIEALLLASELRLLAEPVKPRPVPRRRGARTPARAPAVPGAPRPPAEEGALRSWPVLAARVGALLARPLSPADERRILVEAVRAAARLGLSGEALRYLPDLFSSDPNTTVGAEELFRAAFLPTLARTPEALRGAATAFQAQAALYREVGTRRRAAYWAGRTLQALGREDAARAHFAPLVTAAVPDLYARWAGQRLGVPVFSPPAVETDTPVSRFPLRPDAPSLPSRELLAVGLASLAEDAAEGERSAEPLFLAACASERFEFRRTTAILKGRWPELGTPDEGALPLAVRRAFYPFRQEALIVREASANGIPPALVYGLIRQESLFQTEARSGAGATGLMQVMPGTGQYLYRKENRRGRPDLRDPEVNVKLGARYLAMLLKTFDGDRIAALAGYNAGPGRPLRWRRQAPGLAADEFLEAMPIFEPRDYVRRVLFFEAAYAALHGIPLDPLPLPGSAPVSPGP